MKVVFSSRGCRASQRPTEAMKTNVSGGDTILFVQRVSLAQVSLLVKESFLGLGKTKENPPVGAIAMAM